MWHPTTRSANNFHSKQFRGGSEDNQRAGAPLLWETGWESWWCMLNSLQQLRILLILDLRARCSSAGLIRVEQRIRSFSLALLPMELEISPGHADFGLPANVEHYEPAAAGQNTWDALPRQFWRGSPHSLLLNPNNHQARIRSLTPSESSLKPVNS